MQNKEESVSRNSVLSLAVLVEKRLKQKCLFISEGRQPRHTRQGCRTNGRVCGWERRPPGACPPARLLAGLAAGSSGPTWLRKKPVSFHSRERVRLLLGELCLGSSHRLQTFPFFKKNSVLVLCSLTALLCVLKHTAFPPGPAACLGMTLWLRGLFCEVRLLHQKHA